MKRLLRAASIKQRLQKVIASSGLASRREADQWIADGRVAVNNSTVTELGLKVDPDVDVITVDGKALPAAAQKYYYAYYKPRNVLVARSDPRGRPLIYDQLKDLPTLLHPVGRLDFDSEGLLLLTNDGALQQRLTHPSSEIPKVYHVKVKGPVKPTTLERFCEGVELADGWARAVSVEVIKENPNNCWLEIAVTEGRNRLVRRICDAFGHPVLRLIRVAIATLTVDGLKPGAVRPLTATEVEALQAAVQSP